MSQSVTPLGLLYIYANEDERARVALEKHLSALRRQGLIADWHSHAILPGEDRNSQMNAYLEAADIILLLVSAHFMASNTCWDVGLRRALARSALTGAGKACVIPVIVSPVDWGSAPFGHLQPLPQRGKPVSTWKDRDQAWADVANGICAVVDSLRTMGCIAAPSTLNDPATPRPGALRRFVAAVLVDETDFLNFCRDHFEDAYRRISSSMDRKRQLLFLLDAVSRDGEELRLLEALRRDFRKAYDKHKGLLDAP